MKFKVGDVVEFLYQKNTYGVIIATKNNHRYNYGYRYLVKSNNGDDVEIYSYREIKLSTKLEKALL